MTKKNIIPTVVLALICLFAALLLALTNMITAPEIERQLIEKANAAKREVLPDADATTFEDITNDYDFPESIQGAFKADTGYVFQITYKGYNPDNVMMCGIDNEGNLVKSKIITYTDTYEYQNKLDMSHNGIDLDTAKTNVELATTATSDTGKGYNKALTAAVNAYTLITKGEAAPDEEESEEETKPEIFDNGGFQTKTDEEAMALAKEAFGLTSIEALEIPEDNYNKLPSVLMAAYKTDKGYVLYTATTTQYIKPYGMNETEALIATDKFGTVTEVKLITWKVWGDTSTLDPDFVEQINDTSALVASLNGTKYGIVSGVDVVSNATNSSNNLVASVIDSLKALKSYINSALTENDIKDLALTLVPGAISLEKLEIEDMPATLKAVYLTNDKSSYIFHIQTSTQYVAKETEALIVTTAFGTIKKLEVINWNVGHGVYATEEYLDSYLGSNLQSLEGGVELVSNATGTSVNLRNAVADALKTVFPTPIYTYIAIAIMAIALVISVSLAVVFKRRRRI